MANNKMLSDKCRMEFVNSLISQSSKNKDQIMALYKAGGFNGFFDNLTEREIEILNERYVKNHTYEEIGQKLGLSSTRIQQIVHSAVRTIAGYVANNSLSSTNVRMLLQKREISSRTGNSLLRCGMNDLKSLDVDKLGSMRSVGIKSLEEVYNLCLKHHIPNSQEIYDMYLKPESKESIKERDYFMQQFIQLGASKLYAISLSNLLLRNNIHNVKDLKKINIAAINGIGKKSQLIISCLLEVEKGNNVSIENVKLKMEIEHEIKTLNDLIDKSNRNISVFEQNILEEKQKIQQFELKLQQLEDKTNENR